MHLGEENRLQCVGCCSIMRCGSLATSWCRGKGTLFCLSSMAVQSLKSSSPLSEMFLKKLNYEGCCLQGVERGETISPLLGQKEHLNTMVNERTVFQTRPLKHLFAPAPRVVASIITMDVERRQAGYQIWGWTAGHENTTVQGSLQQQGHPCNGQQQEPGRHTPAPSNVSGGQGDKWKGALPLSTLPTSGGLCHIRYSSVPNTIPGEGGANGAPDQFPGSEC